MADVTKEWVEARDKDRRRSLNDPEEARRVQERKKRLEDAIDRLREQDKLREKSK